MNNQLPEAPASTNVRVQLPSGRQYQLTMRTDTVNKVVKQIEEMEKIFDEKGWTVPEWQQEGKSQAKQYSIGATIHFGKHKGKKWEDIPTDYLTWLISSEKTKADVREKATSVLENKSSEAPPLTEMDF